MSGRRLRAYLRRAASFAAAISVLVSGCIGASADTIEWALVQAYQNNPSLNAQRASLRSTDENVPQALSGYRPKIAATATAGYNYSSTLSRTITQPPTAPVPNFPVYSNLADDFASRGRRRHRHADALQRQSDRQQNPPGGKPGDGRARNAARHRAASAARRGDRLYGSAARRRHPRSAAQQRRSAHRAAETDARPLQCRRSDAHRRGAGRIAARRRPLAIARRPVAIRDVAGAISPHHRRRPRQACPRHAGRPAVAADAAGRHHARPAAKPLGARRHVRRRHRRAAGEGQRRQSLSQSRRSGLDPEGLGSRRDHAQTDPGLRWSAP